MWGCCCVVCCCVVCCCVVCCCVVCCCVIVLCRVCVSSSHLQHLTLTLNLISRLNLTDNRPGYGSVHCEIWGKCVCVLVLCVCKITSLQYKTHTPQYHITTHTTHLRFTQQVSPKSKVTLNTTTHCCPCRFCGVCVCV